MRKEGLNMRKTMLAAAIGAALMGSVGTAHAYLIFSGEDINSSSSNPLTSIPNSAAAEAGFLSNLVGVGTEDFEGLATGSFQPLALTFPGAGTATLNGGNGAVASVAPGSTNGFGRYSIPSASSSNYWEVSAGGSGNFVVNFSDPVAAFGFYGIDIGDFGGQLELELSNGDVLNVGNTEGSFGSTDGSVLFFGFIAESVGELFTSVSFLTTTGQGDVFAFDNFTVGSLEQVNPVPEPTTLALMGLGLAGLGYSRRRKRVG